uniref:receptor protein-tyrosine kinase n=1 Tax=Acrobeloides nanus TaxID=290746 RepID=A0A914DYN5_9BILA
MWIEWNLHKSMKEKNFYNKYLKHPVTCPDGSTCSPDQHCCPTPVGSYKCSNLPVCCPNGISCSAGSLCHDKDNDGFDDACLEDNANINICPNGLKCHNYKTCCKSPLNQYYCVNAENATCCSGWSYCPNDFACYDADKDGIDDSCVKNWNPCLDGTPCKDGNACCQIDNGYACVEAFESNDTCCAAKNGNYLHAFTCGKDDICVQHYQNASTVCQSTAFEKPKLSNTNWKLILASAFALIAIFGATILFVWRRYFKKPSFLKGRWLLITSDEYEIYRHMKLGSGQFGAVYKGHLNRDRFKIPVAIKEVNPEYRIRSVATGEDFLKEAEMMASLNHPHLTKIIGIHAVEDVKIFTLFREHGSLLDFLQKKKNTLGGEDLVRYAFQISQAMEYLASRNITHCDLATRNVLVKQKNHVEVADFGLAISNKHEDDENQKILPVKWASIELLEGRSKFSEATDVWAFGVTCWEIFNFGAEPYEEIKNNLKENLIERLKKGAFLVQPQICHISTKVSEDTTLELQEIIFSRYNNTNYYQSLIQSDSSDAEARYHEFMKNLQEKNITIATRPIKTQNTTEEYLEDSL